MADIMLDLERLREAQAGVAAAVAEFKDASDINNDLEEAIGRPDDRSALRDKASDFESAWNGKRDTLTENLENINKQLKSIIDGWDEWDTTTASDLEGATEQTTTNVNRVA
jgi:Sec-independent protein translocase protein TatA